VLLGDHHQLPPVIKNRAFQKYSHMEQSLFTRFVRLGMPYIQLNAQGRCRPSIAKLWNWKYDSLTDLPNVKQAQYIHSNVGLVHEYQFINVDDYNGVGESTPTPFFYQNLGEAEYIVQTYMYMRLMGYPASSISIITTYNGQKHLLRDIIEARCANNPLFGRPAKISTVDKFQGQQNDCK
jgi:intron-binding protein aquarius